MNFLTIFFLVLKSIDRENNNLGSPKSKRERILPKESADHHQKAKTKAPLGQGVFSTTTVTSNVTTEHKPDNHRSKQQTNENRRWFTPESQSRAFIVIFINLLNITLADAQ